MTKKPETFQTTFGQYTALGTLGMGGSGKVLKVQDEEGQIYALKHLLPDKISHEKIKRFKNELSFCETNRHRNIVQVIDRGVTIIHGTSCPFYVMPYYAGNLRKLMDAGIAPDNVMPYYAQILDGVEAAHLKSVWHRDLKPENILHDPRSGDLVVADFGIAHFEESLLQTSIVTQPNSRLANFQYAAPEQRERNGVVDHRADIWTLGLLLNEMFTGKLAIGVGFTRIGDKYQHWRYLDDLVDAMLKQSPANRPASIDEIKTLLRARQLNFVQQQKLDQLKHTVIPDTQLDDPLVSTPPTLVDAKWDDNRLTLHLSKPVNSQWVSCFKNPGSHTSILGYGPETFRIGGNTMTIDAEPHIAQSLIDHTKVYIDMANKQYRSTLENALRREKAKKEDDLKRKIASEEQARRVNSSLKI